jgi:hypothetical protein
VEKYRPMAIGVIIDVKLNNLAHVKEALLNSIGNIPVGEDLFYLYHPDDVEPLDKKGHKIQCIFNYEKMKINPYLALTQTAMILGSEVDEEYRRKVIFIADQYNEKYNEQVDVMLQIDESQRLECEYSFIGIGQQKFNFSKNIENTHIITIDLCDLEKTLDKIFEEEQNGEE